MIVIVCHVPFIFFACKECFLAMIDEATRNAISTALINRAKHEKLE
jgi:hypothetical protein